MKDNQQAPKNKLLNMTINLAAQANHEDEVRDILTRRLNSTCQVWRLQNDGTWTTAGDTTRQFDGAPELCLLPLAEDFFEVIIPVPSFDSWVVTTKKQTSDPDLLQQYALSIQKEIASCNSIRELQLENSEFTDQTISNFEQLAFLKHSAQQLLLADTSYGLEAMAHEILPMLKELVCASDIHLFMTESKHDNQVPVIGGEIVNPMSTRWLIEMFSDQANDHPVVCNCCKSRPEFEGCRDIDNFVIARIQHGNHFLGWIVVVNKRPSAWKLPKSVDDDARVSEDEFGTVEADVIRSAASMLATHSFNVDLLREKEQLLTSIIRALASALDAKDPYTCGHSERVAAFAKRVASEMDLAEGLVENIYLTGLLHDIGKIGIDDATLSHPGPLTDEQFAKVKSHPDGGWAILHEITQLRYVLPGVLYHHERFDGKGYPDGLFGTNIPVEARILAVVDSYDAMTSSRPYRDGMSHEKAIGILAEGAGTQWDPDVVAVFLTIADEIVHIGKTMVTRTNPIRRKGSIHADVYAVETKA